MDLRVIRANYPITEKGIFLNHAATCPISRGSIDTIKELSEQMAEPLGDHFYQWLGILEDCRRRLGNLMEVPPGDIAFSQNTSTSLSLIANSVKWRPGDRVLCPSDEFPSNHLPWQNLQHQGVEFSFFDLQPGVPVHETLARMDLKGVRLISLSQVGYKSGRHHDIFAFGKFCRERGILSCIDAIQALGVVPVLPGKAGIDFLASGGQKWLLGPVGCGILYVRRELLPELHVPFVGWTSVRYPEDFSIKNLDFSPESNRFEPGLPNVSALGGLNQSLKELEALGWDWVRGRIQENARKLYGALKNKHRMTVQVDELAGIVSFDLPKGACHRRFQESLKEKGISATVRDGHIRLAPHFYTLDEELQTFLDVLHEDLAKPRVKKKAALRAGSAQRRILLSGATGVLGLEMAKLLYKAGYTITLLGRSEVKLREARDELGPVAASGVDLETVDLGCPESIEALTERLQVKGQSFYGLINAAGVAEADPFSQIESEDFEKVFSINILGTARLTKNFLKKLCSPQACGILNIVNGNGRCGLPLMSAYGASQGALWTWGESLGRELAAEGLAVTTFIAPPMHSKMQKSLGRKLLRYFSLRGTFDYAHPDDVAKRALQAFFSKKPLGFGLGGRLKLALGQLLPNLVSQKVAKRYLPATDRELRVGAEGVDIQTQPVGAGDR